MQWLIDIVIEYIAAELGHVWDIKDIVPDDQQIIIGDGSIWKGELISSIIARYPRYVDRGSRGTWDFLDGQFTTDGTWQEMSLASIIPVGTKAVVMKLNILDDLVGSWIQFKTRNYPDSINSSQALIQVANITVVEDITVAPNAQRLIQYRTNNTPFTNIRLCVKGWWL